MQLVIYFYFIYLHDSTESPIILRICYKKRMNIQIFLKFPHVDLSNSWMIIFEKNINITLEISHSEYSCPLIVMGEKTGFSAYQVTPYIHLL